MPLDGKLFQYLLYINLISLTCFRIINESQFHCCCCCCCLLVYVTSNTQYIEVCVVQCTSYTYLPLKWDFTVCHLPCLINNVKNKKLPYRSYLFLILKFFYMFVGERKCLQPGSFWFCLSVTTIGQRNQLVTWFISSY